MYEISLEPKNCWREFQFFEEIEDLLISTLGLKERNEGNWVYQSFTNWSQTWELSDANALLATVDLSCSEDDCERIESLRIMTLTEDFKGIVEIKTLVDMLCERFDLVVKG